MISKKGVFNLIIFLVSIMIVYSSAIISGFFTSRGIDSLWYETIKPDLAPPNWVFAIVWNVLYLLIAFSLYSAWNSGEKRKRIALVFGINIFLSMLWSFIFFYIQNPLYAFIEIVALWISIIVLIIFAYKSKKLSGYLLVPYFFWVTFATTLNYLMAFPNGLF